jgi:hypothetical protein
MDRAARSLMCLFGLKCRRGLDCHCGHTDVEKKVFADRKALRVKEWMAPCGFCAVGRCRYGAECQRSIRSRMSNEAYQKQSAPAAESESDYASAESGSDSGSESADEAGMTGPAGCGAEGMVPDSALVPFLSKDFTKVTKGWRPNVSSKVVKGEYRGFGEASVYWILNVLPVSPGSDNGDRGDNDEQCAEDAIDFVFRQSKGAVMSQKAQKRISKQKRVEVVWAGPAVVREQRAVRRAPIRGTGVRKVLFDDNDGSGSTDDVPMVDQQHRLQSLRKIQLWLWRRQVQDHLCVLRICFQKWVGGGLAGWFIRNYARRFTQFCRDVSTRREKGWDVLERGGVSMRRAEYHTWMNIGKWVDERDLAAGNLFRQWISALPKGECRNVQVAATRQSAATVLRTVLLYRAVEVAQDSDLTYLKGSFEGWLWRAKRDIQIRIQDIEWLCVGVMRDLFIWEFQKAWRRWRLWVGVHRAEKVLRRLEMGQLRGAIRQWWGCLYAEWMKEADAHRTAEVPYNWSRVVRKGQVQQRQAEAKQMAAAIKAKKAAATAMYKCMQIVVDLHWKGPSRSVGFGKGSEHMRTWNHQYMTDWYTKDGYGCH